MTSIAFAHDIYYDNLAAAERLRVGLAKAGVTLDGYGLEITRGPEGEYEQLAVWFSVGDEKGAMCFDACEQPGFSPNVVDLVLFVARDWARNIAAKT